MGLVDNRKNSHSSTQPATPPTVIDVTSVALADTPLPEVPYKLAVEALLTKPPSNLFPDRQVDQVTEPIEACSRYHGQLAADVCFHPLVEAVHLAFEGHRPLVLSPDMIWLLVAQGFANHVNANAEELRSRFVEHPGKVTIQVRRDDFCKGSPENPWPEVFDEFSQSIRGHIGVATHDLLLPGFSTTGAAEKAATEIVLLDAMQSFFSFELMTMCGIPQIVLEGTTTDWEMLADRVRNIGQFGIQWWTDALAPILDEFIAASRGHANRQFWQSIYKISDGSGGPYITGWITAFFPYFRKWRTTFASEKNCWLVHGGKELEELLYPPAQDEDDDEPDRGPTTENFPSGLARAPFLWKYVDRSFPMELIGGFVGVSQEVDTLRLRPEIGWAVRESTAGKAP